MRESKAIPQINQAPQRQHVAFRIAFIQTAITEQVPGKGGFQRVQRSLEMKGFRIEALRRQRPARKADQRICAGQAPGQQAA